MSKAAVGLIFSWQGFKPLYSPGWVGCTADGSWCLAEGCGGGGCAVWVAADGQDLVPGQQQSVELQTKVI